MVDNRVLIEQLGDGVLAVSLVGEHDLSTAGEFRERVAESFIVDDRLLIDLSQATFIDSTIVGVLFDLLKDATSHGGDRLAVVAAAGGAVDRTLSVSGFAPLLTSVWRSREEALAAWA